MNRETFESSRADVDDHKVQRVLLKQLDAAEFTYT